MVVGTNPFALIEPELRQLEEALSQIIGDYDKCVTTKYWPRYWQQEARVRAVERSIRREHKRKHPNGPPLPCVFGGGQSCQERLVSNCDACVPGESQ